MKASELRNGNFIDHEGIGLLVVFGINAHTDEILTDYELRGQGDWWGIENFQPIPLTEEWLLKFSFEKFYSDTLDNDYEKHTCYGLGRDKEYQVHFVHSFYGGSDVYEFVFYSDLNSITSIQYVHQLQNLYFALTGQEFTIKQLV